MATDTNLLTKNIEKDNLYGKAFFKTLFFGTASAISGAIIAIPSLSSETIISSALESGAGGLVIGGLVLGSLALIQHNPKVDLKIVVPMLGFALSFGHQWFGHDSNEISTPDLR